MTCTTVAGATRGIMLRCRAASTAASAASAASAAAAARRRYTAPVKDMRFLRTEVFGFDSHYGALKHLHGDQATPDMVEMVIDENAKFAEHVLAPLNHAADTTGCEYVDEHTVRTPPGFKEAYAQWNEGGWFGMTLPEKYGARSTSPTAPPLAPSCRFYGTLEQACDRSASPDRLSPPSSLACRNLKAVRACLLLSTFLSGSCSPQPTSHGLCSQA
jgi:hypothetical protein